MIRIKRGLSLPIKGNPKNEIDEFKDCEDDGTNFIGNNG